MSVAVSASGGASPPKSKPPKAGLSDEFAKLYSEPEEKAVIGAMIIDPKVTSLVTRIVDASDFFVPVHAAVFRAIKALWTAGSGIDDLTIAGYLEKNDPGVFAKGTQAEFMGLLATLSVGAASASMIESHAERVREKSCYRRMVVQAQAAITAATEGDTAKLKGCLDNALSAMDSVKQHDPFQPINLKTFLAEEAKKPAAEIIIQGLLTRGSKMVLAGASKTNKTWSLLDLAIAVGSGQEWWGMPTKRGKVLYVDMELQEWQLYQRINKLLEVRKLATPELISVIPLRGYICAVAEMVSNIKRACPKDTSLIIIDPIYKLNLGRDENSAGEIGEVLNMLEGLATATGAAVCYAAHFSKGNQANKEAIDRISGSGVFGRDADALMTITKHEVEGCFTVESTLRNFAPINPFVMRWTYPQMVREDGLDPAKLKKLGGRKESFTAEEILELVSKPMAYSEWLRAAKDIGCTKPTFDRKRRELVVAKAVELRDGKYIMLRNDVF